jgi:PAS domain S-box-containing protein
MTQSESGALRQRAEAQFQANTAELVLNLDQLTPAATQQLVHELRVHQIELEMQNEELRRAEVALETSRARYFDLYDLAPVGYCTVNQRGLILEANLAATNLLGMTRGTLIKQPISRFVFKPDQDVYYRIRKQVLELGASDFCELRMIRSPKAEFWARLDLAASQGPDGEPVLRVVIGDVTERRQVEAALQVAQQRLHQFTLRQQEEFDKLHAELARDVHDELGQIFAALKLEIDLVRSIVPTQRLYDLVQAGFISVRGIRRALHPVALELGLPNALRAMVTQLALSSHARIKTELAETLPALAGPVERGLYRIAQEALTNAVLHAQAHEIDIALRVYPSRLELEVCDDGQGFALDSAAVSQGLGLLGMRERASQLGAQLSLRSAAGKGCQMLVTLATHGSAQ